MTEHDRPTAINLMSGKQLDLDNPDPDVIEIEEIAHYLSNMCRWGGHVSEFYSVAQHSVMVSRIAPAKFALVALLHDASEAYIGDMVRPLKKRMPEFSVLEERIMKVVAQKFQFDWPMPPEVVEADNAMLAQEHWQLRGDQDPTQWNPTCSTWYTSQIGEITPWTPYMAKKRFMARFYVARANNLKVEQADMFAEEQKENLRRALVGYDEAMSKPADGFIGNRRNQEL